MRRMGQWPIQAPPTENSHANYQLAYRFSCEQCRLISPGRTGSSLAVFSVILGGKAQVEVVERSAA